MWLIHDDWKYCNLSSSFKSDIGQGEAKALLSEDIHKKEEQVN